MGDVLYYLFVWPIKIMLLACLFIVVLPVAVILHVAGCI